MRSERRNLFRSIDGCTICQVKSARHLFQASQRWSKYFEQVFQLKDNRTSEICHLCLKSLKKWRRAPKTGKPDFSSIVNSKYVKRKSSVRKRRHSSLVEMEIGTKEENKLALMEEDDMLSESETSEPDYDSSGVPDTYFDTPSPNSISDEDNDDVYLANDLPPCIDHASVSTSTADASCQTSFLFPMLTSPQGIDFKLPYIDLSKWRQEQICCGVIFRGPSGEVLVDPNWLNPSCNMCNRSCATPTISKMPKDINPFDEKLLKLVQSSS